MNLQCHVCGMRFRSMLAEAKHRHNFPLMCRPKKVAKPEAPAPSDPRMTPRNVDAVVEATRRAKLME